MLEKIFKNLHSLLVGTLNASAILESTTLFKHILNLQSRYLAPQCLTKGAEYFKICTQYFWQFYFSLLLKPKRYQNVLQYEN